MKWRFAVLLAAGLLGALCVGAAGRLLGAVGRPELGLRLVPIREEGRLRLAFRFTNPGRDAVVLDGRGLEYFLQLPEVGSDVYVLQMQSGGVGASAGEDIVIPAGASVDVGDVYQLVKDLPPGVLRAVFVSPADGKWADRSGTWQGVVHARPLAVGKR